MAEYQFTKQPVDVDRLTQEIHDSSIVIVLDHITVYGAALSIFFKADLSNDDQSTLSSIVTNHSGEPLIIESVTEVKIVEQTDPPPFAEPTFRTKMNAAPSVVTIAANSSENIDFQLTAERYVHGGSITVENAMLGDYVTAEVYDKDNVIPEAYRAALCENWPSVAKYVEKQWIEVNDSSYCTMEIDAKPLCAKIPAGLYLRVTYFTIDGGSSRRVVVNYHLTKKL